MTAPPPGPTASPWDRPGPLLNAWLSLPCAVSAEAMARQGYDCATVDLQHGLIGYETALAMLQALAGTGVIPIVRVPALDAAWIGRVLDAGALGVIVPLIETAAQAAALVAAARYPPLGARSYGPTRAALGRGDGYRDWSDRAIKCLAMIETREGFANRDAILATPGLDGVYVGPSDLALGLTGRAYRPGLDRTEPELEAAILAIRDSARAAGRLAGIQCADPAYAWRMAAEGFGLVTFGSDLRNLIRASAADVAAFRSAQLAGAGGGAGAGTPASVY
jgi:4-hydroxy-2-oxoheptanedioate aldolase